jgi:hypothetical protein
VTASYNRDQIRAALTETDDNYTNYLDVTTGTVVRVHATDEEALNGIVEELGDRYRYIPGGNAEANDAAVDEWLEAEGL